MIKIRIFLETNLSVFSEMCICSQFGARLQVLSFQDGQPRHTVPELPINLLMLIVVAPTFAILVIAGRFQRNRDIRRHHFNASHYRSVTTRCP